MDATQIILIVFVVLLLIAYPILVTSRNKKENQRLQEQTNSLKRGDKVLTTSGVYGTIVDLEMNEDKKIVTIETGSGKNKGYVSIDAFAIYTIIKDTPKEEKKDEKSTKTDGKKAEDKKPEEKSAEKSNIKENQKTEAKPEIKTQEPKAKAEDKTKKVEENKK